MKYPDGSIVKLGDRVWWDDEGSIGKIIEIHETQEQCARCGVEEPGVLICYDGSETVGNFIGCPLRCFVEDGIRRLSAEEEAQVDSVVQAAHACFLQKTVAATVGLFRKLKSDREYWYVVLYHDRQALEVIEVDPAKLSCRNIPLEPV